MIYLINWVYLSQPLNPPNSLSMTSRYVLASFFQWSTFLVLYLEMSWGSILGLGYSVRQLSCLMGGRGIRWLVMCPTVMIQMGPCWGPRLICLDPTYTHCSNKYASQVLYHFSPQTHKCLNTVLCCNLFAFACNRGVAFMRYFLSPLSIMLLSTSHVCLPPDHHVHVSCYVTEH